MNLKMHTKNSQAKLKVILVLRIVCQVVELIRSQWLNLVTCYCN